MHDVCSAVCKSIQVGLVVNRYTIRYYPPLTGSRLVPFYLIRSRLWMKPRNPEQPTKHVWNHAYIHQKYRIKGNEGGWLLIFIYYCLPSAFVKHPAGLEMGRVKTAFSCDWQEVNHAFRSVFSCFYVVHEGQFYCDFEFSLGFTVYSWHVGVRKRFLLGSQRAQNLSGSHFFRWSLHLR